VADGRLSQPDPLGSVRSPRGMVPTSRAQDIAPSVRSILEQVEGVLRGGRAFDPAASTRQFVLIARDGAPAGSTLSLRALPQARCVALVDRQGFSAVSRRA